MGLVAQRFSCVVGLAVPEIFITPNRKSSTGMKPVPLKTIQGLKRGERPGGGRPLGVWVNSRRVHCSQNYADRSGGPVTLRKTTTASTKMQAKVITGIFHPAGRF